MRTPPVPRSERAVSSTAVGSSHCTTSKHNYAPSCYRDRQIQRLALVPSEPGPGLPLPRTAPLLLCIDEVFDQVAGTRLPVFCCVDLVTNITLYIPIERANSETSAASMRQVRALGADPKIIVSDL